MIYLCEKSLEEPEIDTQDQGLWELIEQFLEQNQKNNWLYGEMRNKFFNRNIDQISLFGRKDKENVSKSQENEVFWEFLDNIDKCDEVANDFEIDFQSEEDFWKEMEEFSKDESNNVLYSEVGKNNNKTNEIHKKEKFKTEEMPHIDTKVQVKIVKYKMINAMAQDEFSGIGLQKLGSACEHENNTILTLKRSGEIQERLEKIKMAIKMDGLERNEGTEIWKICSQFNDIFYVDGDKLSYCDLMEHKIPTNDEVPIYVRQYKLPQMQKLEIKQKLEKMLKENIICESNSPWNSPAILVEKKSEDGKKKWRLVIDYRKLNEISIADSFPIPNISDILDQLGGAKYFSTLDLANGYHQLLVHKKDREKTAFSTDSNHYEWIRMPMGLKNAGRTFQRVMNRILTGLIGEDCFVYLDDIVIYGKNLEDHNEKLIRIFNRIKKFNLKLQPEKCKFLRKETIYLGHLITADGIMPDPAKIECVLKFPRLRKEKDVKSFLGLVGYYRKFIDNFAGIAKPLTQLLRKNVPFKWTEKCQNAFDVLKQILTTSPILQYPNFEKEFILTTDSSGFAISAILSQGEIGNDLPVAFASRTMNDAETRYGISEQEMLAVVWGVQQYRPYLWGRKFKVVSDHQALVWIFNVKNPSSRLFRWKIKLAEYDYEIIHKKGKLNLNADALSRIKLPETAEKEIQVVTRAKARQLQPVIESEEENESHVENQKSNKNDADKKENDHKPGVWEKEFSEKNNYIQNKIHLIAQNANVLNELIDQNLEEPKIGEVVHKFKRDNNDFYLIVKDPINNDIPLRSFYHSFVTLRALLEEKAIFKIGLVKLDNTFENMDFSRAKRIIKNIFEGSKIEFTIFSWKIMEIIDENQINELIRELHYSKIGGHVGVNRLEKRIKQFYIFNDMKKKIQNVVLSCDLCQKNKVGKITKIPMAITTTARNPFERIALDIVGPLPETMRGNKYLLTFQDDLTKFIETIPLPDQESETIARAFVHHIILKFSSPETILTDNGTNFVSKLFQNTCKILGIKRKLTTAYHQQTNGALERTHRTLKEFLRNYINNERNNWDETIQFGTYVFNTTPHTATSFSPYELLYGFKSRLPNALKTKPQVVYNYDDYLFELKYRMQNAHTIARESQIRRKEKSKIYYDKTTNVENFEEGDWVLLENSCIKGQGRKLQPLYVGPYQIISCPSITNTEIRITKNKSKIVHNNLLKKFRHEANNIEELEEERTQ